MTQTMRYKHEGPSCYARYGYSIAISSLISTIWASFWGIAANADTTAQKNKPFLHPPDNGLVRMLFQSQLTERLIQHPDGLSQLPPGWS
jgi:hypothetical protein